MSPLFPSLTQHIRVQNIQTISLFHDGDQCCVLHQELSSLTTFDNVCVTYSINRFAI